MKYDIKDIKLAPEGKKLIEWAVREMPVLKLIRERFAKQKPLKGVVLGACLHVTSETANLAITLKKGGAEVILCASNPLSTNDSVAASLVKDYGIPVYAIKGEDNKTYYKHLNTVLDYKPNLTMDDGADLVGLLHSKRTEMLQYVIGSNEETTTGVIRLRAMEKDNALRIPVLAVNDNMTKHLFDNRYGTGQSTIDGIIRATNILLAGKNFVVCGYGWCGRGLAMRAKGMGAQVIICEVNPIKALEAKMDGYEVMPIQEAIQKADILVSVTGNKHVIDEHHFKTAKNGIILANAGHFDVEINIDGLKKLSKKVRKVRPMVTEYLIEIPIFKSQFSNKSQNTKSKFQKKYKSIYLLTEGRLVNLSAADGHPASVMDMSFSGQALGAEYMWNKRRTRENKVYSLPKEIDEKIAMLKLHAEGVAIDTLTKEQKTYLRSWREGT